MKIEGCATGKHLFVGAKKDEVRRPFCYARPADVQTKEELVNCRMDHYQTPTQVHVSAFAKG